MLWCTVFVLYFCDCCFTMHSKTFHACNEGQFYGGNKSDRSLLRMIYTAVHVLFRNSLFSVDLDGNNSRIMNHFKRFCKEREAFKYDLMFFSLINFVSQCCVYSRIRNTLGSVLCVQETGMFEVSLLCQVTDSPLALVNDPGASHKSD